MIHVKKAWLRDKLFIPKPSIYGDMKNEFIRHIDNQFITVLGDAEPYWVLPSGCLEYFKIEELHDETTWEPLEIPFNGILRPEQEDVMQQFINNPHRGNIIEAPCSFGKTYLSARILNHYSATSLILVHKVMLMDQWYEELTKLTGLPIGRAGDGIMDIKPITVAIYHTVNNHLEKFQNFSVCGVDEVHNAGAEIYSNTMNNINARYKFGLSATPERKDGKHILFKDYFGTNHIIGDASAFSTKPKVKVYQTPIDFGIVKNPKTDWAKALNRFYGNNSYLDLIVKIALKYKEQGRCLLILGERLAFLQQLQLLLPHSALVVGETKREEREKILSLVGNGIDFILSTTLFDEGISCHRLDTLISTTPTSNFTKLKQRIGRIERDHPLKQYPLVIDLWLKGKLAESQQKKRYNWYKQQGYEIF